MKELKVLMAALIFAIFMVPMVPSLSNAREVTTVVTPSCSASDNVAACISPGDRYTVITYYINPLGNLNKGITSYITLVIMDNQTGKLYIRKIPERDFENRKTFLLNLRSHLPR